MFKTLLTLFAALVGCSSIEPGTYIEVSGPSEICHHLMVSHVPSPTVGLRHVGIDDVEPGEHVRISAGRTTAVSATCADPHAPWTILSTEIVDNELD